MSGSKLRFNLRRRWSRLRGDDRWAVPVREFRVRTPDGESLAVTRLGEHPGRAIVVAHALLGYRTKPAWRRISESLATAFTVYAVDLRGHGDSTGRCAGGPLEALDVRAVVDQARRDGFGWVGTLGGSLGGAAVLFEAASRSQADLVVAISPPARWVRDTLHEPSADGGILRRRLLWLFDARPAQIGAAIVFGVEMAPHWTGAEAPIDIVDRIRVPLLLVHGDDDHLFPVASIQEMAARAVAPTQLVVRDGFGHCEDGFDADFCAWLTRTLRQAAEGASWAEAIV